VILVQFDYVVFVVDIIQFWFRFDFVNFFLFVSVFFAISRFVLSLVKMRVVSVMCNQACRGYGYPRIYHFRCECFRFR